MLILLALLFAAIHVSLALYNGQVYITNILGRTGWLFWIVAVLGIIILCLVSCLSSITISRLSINKFDSIVRLLSSGTIIILCVHEVLLNYSIDFFLVNHSFHIPLVVRELILSMAVLVIFVPIIWFVKRYVPILNGYRK